MYIANEQNILFTDFNSNITSYGIDNLKDIEDSSSNQFDYSHGIKIDGKNHNFVIFREFLSLGFSYMTFVIKN